MMRRSSPAGRPHHFYRLFCQASPLEGPEKLLVISILWKAVSDALSKRKEDTSSKHDAQVFFSHGNYRPFCELVDLDPDWVGEVLRDYAGIECGANWGRTA